MKGYRKFLFSCGMILCATALVIWGKLTGDQYVALATATTVAFLGANAAQNVGEKLAARKTETTK